MDRKTVRQAVFIGLLFCFLGIVIAVKDRAEDTARQGYLVRGDYGESAYQEDLGATVDGHRENVTVTVEPRSFSRTEAEAFFDQAEKVLPEMIFGTGTDLVVDQDLSLPAVITGLPVTVEYFTDNSLILSYDGTIGPDASNDGSEAVLEAVLHCGEYSRAVTFPLTVYPRAKADLSFQARIDEAVAEANRTGEAGEPAGTAGVSENKDTEKWYLPSSVDGKPVAWESNTMSTGVSVAALGLVIAVLYLFAVKRRAEEHDRRIRESLLRDYPHIVSKLVLLLEAGLSMRRAFHVMTEDYQKALASTHQKRWGFEAVGQICADLDAGLTEADAYHRLGQRCDLPAYRTFSVLLTQNLRRGSRELIAMLEREAFSAFEERKKEARILGERASAKLLAPMMLMLLIVFVIVMVPAFLSF